MQPQNLQHIIKQKTASSIGNLFGIIIFIVGALILYFGPAGYFESFSDRVAESNKIGFGVVPITIIIGLFLYVMGYRMIRHKKKTIPQELPADQKTDNYAFVYSEATKTNTPLGQVAVSLNNQGITVQSLSQTQNTSSILKWQEITGTEWSSIYSYDAYKIKTPAYDLYLMSQNPTEAQKQTRKYWAVSTLSQTAGLAYGAKLVGENENNISVLLALHIYCRAYIPRRSTKWTNFFEDILFTTLSRIAVLAGIIIWASSLATGLDHKNIASIIITFGVIVGMSIILYSLNKQLRQGQKLLGSKLF